MEEFGKATFGMGETRRPNKRFGKQRVATIAAGLAFGLTASQILPAADVLERALRETGVGSPVAGLLVAAAFTIGGIEGSLLICPLIMKIRSRRGRS